MQMARHGTKYLLSQPGVCLEVFNNVNMTGIVRLRACVHVVMVKGCTQY